MIVTKQYLKRKFPGNHAMHELIDYISPASFVAHVASQNEDSFFQEAHGFEVGNAVRQNGTVWVKALADSAENAQTFGIISMIMDVNNFRVKYGGILPGNWIPGMEYFLSVSTPGLVEAEPAVYNIGEVRQSLGWGTPQGLKIEIDVGDIINDYSYLRTDWIEFEFRDVLAGTVMEYILNLKALDIYTVTGIVLQVDDGSLDDISVKVNDALVQGLVGISATAAIIQTDATQNKTVYTGDRVSLNIGINYTGTPLLIRGQLNILRN